jgi:hypothetical protein
VPGISKEEWEMTSKDSYSKWHYIGTTGREKIFYIELSYMYFD